MYTTPQGCVVNNLHRCRCIRQEGNSLGGQGERTPSRQRQTLIIDVVYGRDNEIADTCVDMIDGVGFDLADYQRTQ